MAEIAKDFYSEEHRKFKYRIGHMVASSLSGFIAGIVVTLMVIFALFDITLKS
jgi:hypothetical protein